MAIIDIPFCPNTIKRFDGVESRYFRHLCTITALFSLLNTYLFWVVFRLNILNKTLNI